MQELEYNPSKKDLTDAKIHHLLAEELVKPYRRVRLFFIFSCSKFEKYLSISTIFVIQSSNRKWNNLEIWTSFYLFYLKFIKNRSVAIEIMKNLAHVFSCSIVNLVTVGMLLTIGISPLKSIIVCIST